jgi:hypothetical protein
MPEIPKGHIGRHPEKRTSGTLRGQRPDLPVPTRWFAGVENHHRSQNCLYRPGTGVPWRAVRPITLVIAANAAARQAIRNVLCSQGITATPASKAGA